MRTVYVLIDYENVRPGSLHQLDAERFRVLLFVGANPAKVAFEVADAMQRMGSSAQYAKIAGDGPSALDFHIAFHLGQLIANDPTASFHIISMTRGSTRSFDI